MIVPEMRCLFAIRRDLLDFLISTSGQIVVGEHVCVGSVSGQGMLVDVAPLTNALFV